MQKIAISVKTREQQEEDPILICPGCGNAVSFALKTILAYQVTKNHQFIPRDAEIAFAFLERFARNILFVNHRFLGADVRLPYSLRYSASFITEYNDAIRRDILHGFTEDVKSEYPELKLFGGMIYCVRCRTQALFYESAIYKCLHSDCPGCSICRLVTDDRERALAHCADFCRDMAESGSQENCRRCRYRTLQINHNYSWKDVQNMIYNNLEEELK